ncbi:sensor histidine kinase [Alysiella crassa]|uniref:histidine kinase n=1 Tax=Alysiella crassa TaxID=153491 RepID=A0A376BVU3_9NEIS|nr:HAMP domain-containing sensor histidine kinase [Alysiella crassa]SSY80923.1 Sensor protein CpxA [Alysiella crassa]
MKLFQRIFATFCMVIICAIFVASFSFWLVQTQLAENQSKHQRDMEISLLRDVVNSLAVGGELSVRNRLEMLRKESAAQNIIVITGDSKQDILSRPVPPEEVEHAYHFALKNPNSKLVTLRYDPFGEEYLFFIRNFDRTQLERMPSPFLIPGLPLAPIWHEIIILLSLLAIGLLLAYLLASNITKPIRILEQGINRLAAGELNARVSQQLLDRKDELANLGVQFDRMAHQLEQLLEKERHLLHHVSHEMRSPLARIQAIVGLLQARPEKQADYIARLESELSRMDTLVGELLTLSRLETANIPMERENLQIVPFVQQIVEDSQAVAEKKNHTVQLDVKNIHPEARFEANESYLYRALDNVIRNAMNYSPEGSTIQVNMYEDRKNLHIEIVDNGNGVKPEQLPHIFTAFYRADSSANTTGTGLGLALTKHIVEQHHGKIIAENVQPNGLKMHFILPHTSKPEKIKSPKTRPPKTDGEK